jgi:hypothetical protein
LARTVNPYSIKSLVKSAYEASLLKKASFDDNPQKDAEIKEAVSTYIKMWIEMPLCEALKKMK